MYVCVCVCVCVISNEILKLRTFLDLGVCYCTFRKVRCTSLFFFCAHVGFGYAYGQLCTYKQGSLAGILSPVHRNPIGRSKTTPPPVLLPSGILPSSSSDFYFRALKEKFGRRVKYVITLGFFFFVFKNCVIPKLRDLKLLKSASVSYAINVDRRVLTRVREAVSNMTGHGQGVLLHVSCSIGHSVRLFGCLIGSYLGRCRHDFIESRRHSFLSRSAFEIMNATLQWSKTMCHAVCTFTYYLRFTQKYIRAFMLFCISLNY